MTREKLEARLAFLTEEFNKQRANLEAINGAIHDVRFWLAELDKPADAPMPEAKKAE